MKARTLLDAWRTAPCPTHVDSNLREVARSHLRCLLQHIDMEMHVDKRQGKGEFRFALLFGEFGACIDPSRRIAQGVCRNLKGHLEFGSGPYRLLDPLDASYRLRVLARRLGYLVTSKQRELFCTDRQATELDRWIVRSAFIAVRQDPKYRSLMRNAWPNALGLDRDLIDIALKSRTNPHRRQLSMRDFTTVWQNEAAFRRVARENSKLLPLVLAFADTCEHGLLPAGQDAVAVLRERLLEDGITPAAWRYLARHGARLFRSAWEVEYEVYRPDAFCSASLYLRALQDAGLPPVPPRSIAERLAIDLANVDAAYTHNVAPPACLSDEVLGLALREADRRRRSPTLVGVLCEMQEATRWPVGFIEPLDDNQKRAGWASFMRRKRREWARLEPTLSNRRGDWRTSFAELEFSGLRALPIDSRLGLRFEGESMHNCLADYAERCRIGLVQIVSFRDSGTGRPVGDAAYERQPLSRGVTWRVVEVREFANQLPGKRVERLALACEDVLNVMDLAGPVKEVRKRLRSSWREG